MSNTEVLLINLPLSNNLKDAFKYGNSMPPLGLLYIAGYLREKDINYDVIDFAVTNLNKEQFTSYLIDTAPKIIGISTYNETWQSQKTISKFLRKVFPQIKIVAGGAFATFCYKDMFEEGIVDYVIRGEGENAFYQLYNLIINNKNTTIESISGLVYKNLQNELIVNPVERIKKIDDLPFPDRSQLDLTKYTLGYTVSTARGCPGKCIFCSSKAFWGNKIYFRSVDSIFKEVIEIYEKYQQNIIYFADDAFTLNKKRAIDFCEKIQKTGIRFLFGFESRADVIDEDFIKILYNAGFKKIQIGLESADNEILKRIKKNVTIEQIENAIQLASKYNMHISVSYIIGHAFDNDNTIRKTLDFVKYIQGKYNAYTMGSVNTPFPGTEQYINAKDLGVKIYSSDWADFRLNYPIISTRNISREKLKEYFEELQYYNIKSNS